MKKAFLLMSLILIGVLLAIVVGCSGEEQEPDRPGVPGQATVTIDLSTFQTASLARPNETCAHFDTAAVLVTVWSFFSQSVLAIPRLAFGLALIQPAEYEGEGIWSWTFGADTNNIELTAELLASDSVEWQMRITNSELDHFLWYGGRCDFDASGGWWEFYAPDDTVGTNEVLWVGWQQNEADTTAHLTMANIQSENPDYGDTLDYDVDDGIATVWLNDVDGGRPGKWYITWHLNDHYGRVEYPEGNTGCWDSELNCIPCDSLDLP